MIPTTRDPAAAAAALAAGHLAVLPTETVYGLAADARNPSAVRACFTAKGRPAWHPVIVHVPGVEAASAWGQVTPLARRLLEHFWPGPLTVIIPGRADVDPRITGGRNTVAVRCAAHPEFAAVLAELSHISGPNASVVAPSANRFGRTSPTDAALAHRAIGAWLGAGDLVLDGGPCRVGVESTVVDCTRDDLRILRPGAIGPRELAAVVDPGTIADRGAGTATGPGTLPSHYAPRAPLWVVDEALLPTRLEDARDARLKAGLVAMEHVPTSPDVVRLGSPADSGEFARGLYAWLLAADSLGLDVIIAIPPGPGDVGALATAVRDRLARAAATTPTGTSPDADGRLDRRG